MHNIFSLVVIIEIVICYGIDESEYGIVKPLKQKTEGNITQLESSVTRGYLACQIKCLQVALCDSTVYCSGSCLLFSTRTVSVGIDVLNENNECRLSSFPSRLVCGRHGVKDGQNCTCDEGWSGTYCQLGEILWVEQFSSQSGNKTVLDMALRNGVGVTIVEQSNDTYFYHKPTYYFIGEPTYAQVILEMRNLKNSTPSFHMLNRMFQTDGQISTVSTEGISFSRPSALTWFTKNYSRGIPFFTRIGKTITLGNLTDFANQIQNGGEVRAVIDNTGVVIDVDFDSTSQEIKFLFPLHVEVKYKEDGNLSLASSWSLIVGELSSSFLYRMNVDFNGGESPRHHQQIPINTMNFFLDPEWQEIYRFEEPTENNENQSSFDILQDLVSRGKILRIAFQEQNNLKVLTSRYIEISFFSKELSVFSDAQPMYTNIKENVSPRVRWYNVKSTGILMFCSVDLGFTGVKHYEEDIKTNSTWYVEKRNWHMILKVNTRRDIVEGSVQRLIRVAKSGKRIRAQLKASFTSFIMDINSVDISSSNNTFITSGPNTMVVGRYCRQVTYTINSSFHTKIRFTSFAEEVTEEANLINLEHTYFTDDPLA